VNEADRAEAEAAVRARLATVPPDYHLDRLAALFAAIRLRMTRDHARGELRPASKHGTPPSHPDHDAGNVGPSAPVSGVGN
jgi:hypothetical protein